MNTVSTERADIAVVGFGPAGLATVVGASIADAPQRIIALDQNKHAGSGNLRNLLIDSNSAGEDFTDAIADSQLCQVTNTNEAKPLTGNQQPVPLREVARFLGRVAAEAVRAGLVRHVPDAVASIQLDNGAYALHTKTGKTIAAEKVIVANGAEERLLPELALHGAGTTFKSDDILHGGRKRDVARAIAKHTTVVIVGGSHSAYSSAKIILDEFPTARIVFAKRGPTRPFFRSADEAAEYGYKLTHADTICPETGRINRFNGVRGQARDLWYAEQNGTEPRLQSRHDIDLRAISPEIAVVQAIGYQPRRPELLDADGRPVDYEIINGPYGIAQFVAASSTEPLPNLLGIGIGYSHLDGFNVFCAQAAAYFKSLQRTKEN